MKARRYLWMAGIACLTASFSGFSQDTALIEKGKGVLQSINPKCTMCHAISGHGNPRNPLDGIGSKLSANDIKAWIRTPKEMAAKAKSEVKPPMSAYPADKLSDSDLDALVAYLMSLKSK